jgi:hypothetical protein
MIIKKWSGSAWTAVYPKVTTSEMYEGTGATQLFSNAGTNTPKLKIEYLPDAVFDSLYFQAAFAMSTNSTTNTNNLTNVLQTAMEHARTNRKSASALKGYYFVTSTNAGTINDVESTDTAKQATNATSPYSNFYFRWDWNSNDDRQTSTDGSNNNLSLHNSGQLEVGDWFVVENVFGSGTSSDPYYIHFSIVQNTYEVMTAASAGIGGLPDTAGAKGLVPGPAAGQHNYFLRGDATWAVPTDTNTFRSVTIGGTSIGSSNALDISAGTNVSFSGTASSGDITINAAHPSISAASSVNNSGRTYIQDITLDSNGHITGITSATETVTDTNTLGSTETLAFTEGSNITITESGGAVTIASTDNNTVTSIRRDNTGTYRTGNINLVGGSNVTITETSTGVFSFAATDTNTNTQLSNEQVQDIVGGMVSSNDEAGIAVTYDDAAGKLDFDVDGGVGITQVTGGVKMTYPIAIDADGGSNPTGGTDYRIADGALWFDLS